MGKLLGDLNFYPTADDDAAAPEAADSEDGMEIDAAEGEAGAAVAADGAGGDGMQAVAWWGAGQRPVQRRAAARGSGSWTRGGC
jgi:hypothetical protein